MGTPWDCACERKIVYATDRDSAIYHRVVHDSYRCHNNVSMAFRVEPIPVTLLLTNLGLELSLAT